MADRAKHWEVLFEDNHLLAINKPAGLATMGVAEQEASLVKEAKLYLAEKYDKPGNVYLGVVSRLDAVVSGVVLFARTSKAASRLTEAFRSRSVKKTYLAVVAGVPDEPEAALEHYVRKDERQQKMHTTHGEMTDAKLAKLSYQTLSHEGDYSLLEVKLETGRKHQIRVQLSKIGHPIFGDGKYGSEETFQEGIALHAYRLELEHPVRKEPLKLFASLPKAWKSSSRLRFAAELMTDS
ncbi:MAG: RluA family pseudouridine synthase [Lacipirellulaceae bacterium]